MRGSLQVGLWEGGGHWDEGKALGSLRGPRPLGQGRGGGVIEGPGRDAGGLEVGGATEG